MKVLVSNFGIQECRSLINLRDELRRGLENRRIDRTRGPGVTVYARDGGKTAQTNSRWCQVS